MTKRKKGFTIVELVIVIAVIGILAGILIPVFSNLVREANIASDELLIRELNNALELDTSKTGKTHETIFDALAATDDYGFNVQRINAKASRNRILWDSVHDVFCYLSDEDGVKTLVYQNKSVNEQLAVNDYRLWAIQKTVDTVYSTYLYQYNGEATITTALGIDVSDASNREITTLNYVRTNVSDYRTVYIRTNSENTVLTVNAPNDVVKHYGAVGSLNIIEVAGQSYHEYGAVKFVEISKGRIALETGAEVNHIHVNAKKDANNNTLNEFAEIIISKAASVEMPDLSRDDVEIAATGTLVVALQTGTEEVTSSTELDYVWLTKQGIYEQITVSESKTAAGTTWVNTSDKPAETKTAAQQIANNIGRDANNQIEATVTVGANEYNVVLDSNRNLVLIEENGNPEEPTYTLATDTTTKEIVVKDSNNATVENVVVEVVEAQPDKENVQIGATLFAGGSGTEKDPWYIIDQETFQHVGSFYDANDTTKYYYWEVRNDITEIDMTGWVTINLQGYIIGNNVTLRNLTAPLFEEGARTEETITVENISIESNIVRPGGWVAVVFRSDPGKNVLIDNVDLFGYIEGESVASYMIQNWSNMNAEIRNSQSSVTMFGSGACGGMTGYIGAGTQTSTLNVVNSKYDGTMIRSANSNFTYFGFNNNSKATVSITLDEASCQADFTVNSNAPTATTYSGTWAQIGNAKTLYTNTAKKVVGSLSISFDNNNKVVVAKGTSTRAVATLMVGPNPGNMYAGYYTEELNSNGSNWVSDKLVLFNITCDDNQPIGISADGNSFNVHGSAGNIHIAHILVTLYDNQGNVINVGKYTIPASYYPGGVAH